MLKFKTTEEIERYFKDWKYEEEVHNAIDFLIKENKQLRENTMDYIEKVPPKYKYWKDEPLHSDD